MFNRACKGFSAARLDSIRRRLLPRVNRDAIFVFGNQKSGTTIIAALLADYGGLSVTLDIPVRDTTVKEQDMLHGGKLSFENFVENYKYEFSSDLVKEPALTFLYDQMSTVFSLSRSVFVVRDPRDNLRSILNRVNLRGDLIRSPSYTGIPEAWQRIIDNRWMGLEHDHYIEALAARWNRAADVYLAHSANMVLQRYEDFLNNKIDAIGNMARKLGIPGLHDIGYKVDRQYQSRGDREISWIDFFGRSNLERIEKICDEGMSVFGYQGTLL